jgi:hypothetical protein
LNAAATATPGSAATPVTTTRLIKRLITTRHPKAISNPKAVPIIILREIMQVQLADLSFARNPSFADLNRLVSGGLILRSVSLRMSSTLS